MVTKLYITFKDCYGTIIFQSSIGKSKEKEFDLAYSDALNEAFLSVYALHYKYNGTKAGSKALIIPTAPVEEVPPVGIPNIEVKNLKTSENNNASLLYAQPTSYGYQLVDSEPKVVLKAYKTSNPASYMATKGSVQGVLVSKDNQWFFEYYQNDKLISEKINVKF